jgi:hypothetical protein
MSQVDDVEEDLNTKIRLGNSVFLLYVRLLGYLAREEQHLFLDWLYGEYIIHTILHKV